MIKIRTTRGRVATIGQMKAPKSPIICEIPTLYFLVIEKDGGGYVSSCISLLIDGYGTDISNAIDDMIRNISYFLYESFKEPGCSENAWENITELAKSSPLSDPLWEAYRMYQLELAKKGRDTDRCSDLYKTIGRLHETNGHLLDENRRLRQNIQEKEAIISWSLDSFIENTKITVTVESNEVEV